MTEMESFHKESAERVARQLFGDDPAAIGRWVDYWTSTVARNRELLETFSRSVLIDLEGKRVLDVGCGTAGMAQLVEERGGRYTGVDFDADILALAREYRSSAPLVRASGVQLPFESDAFDYVFAFDVIEHLVGGLPSQLSFARELRRVIHPLGMIFLTTPNKLFPWEGHTFLWGPQYLPRRLADLYIGKANPSFLQEHGSFAAIRLLTPWRLARLVRDARLAMLHELPCCQDVEDLPPFWRWGAGFLDRRPVSWLPLQEFFAVLVRQESLAQLRLKKSKHWFYQHTQPSPGPLRDFKNYVDFREGPFNIQLGPGWHWMEDGAGSSYRWTKHSAVVYLQSMSSCSEIRVAGFCDPALYPSQANTVEVCVDDWRVGQKKITERCRFELTYLIPFETNGPHLYAVQISSQQTSKPSSSDQRQLGLMVFRIELT